MKISIVVPIYGVEKYVGRCLDSLLGQTLSEGVECILVNDATPDRSMEVVGERLGRYTGKMQCKVVNHSYNRGLALARKTGLDCATGEYFIHIDSDDYCEPDMLEQMYAAAVREGADIVVADFYKTYPDREVYVRQLFPASKEELIGRLIENREELTASCCNKLCRRKLTGIEPLYFEGLDMNEDSVACVKMAFFARKVVHLEKAFLHYVQYNVHSYTKDISDAQLAQVVRANEKIREFLIGHDVFDRYREAYFHRLVTARWLFLCYAKEDKQTALNRTYTLPARCIWRYPLPFVWRMALAGAGYSIVWPFNALRRLQKWVSVWKKKRRK